MKKSLIALCCAFALLVPGSVEAARFQIVKRPNIVGMFPHHGRVGQVVTLYGYNFVSHFPRPTVWFGNCLAKSSDMLSYNYKMIRVRVPSCINGYPEYTRFPVRVKLGGYSSRSYRVFTKTY